MKRYRKQWIVLAVVSCVLGLSTIPYTAYELPAHRWVRGYLGDAFTVLCLYALVSAFTGLRSRTKALVIGGFAGAVEASQVLIAGVRGQTATLLVGAHFDTMDLVYYALGIVCGVAVEKLWWRPSEE